MVQLNAKQPEGLQVEVAGVVSGAELFVPCTGVEIDRQGQCLQIETVRPADGVGLEKGLAGRADPEVDQDDLAVEDSPGYQPRDFGQVAGPANGVVGGRPSGNIDDRP